MPALINVLNKTGKKNSKEKIHNLFFVMYDKSIKNAYYLLNELWLHRKKKTNKQSNKTETNKNNKTKQKTKKQIQNRKYPKSQKQVMFNNIQSAKKNNDN